MIHPRRFLLLGTTLVLVISLLPPPVLLQVPLNSQLVDTSSRSFDQPLVDIDTYEQGYVVLINGSSGLVLEHYNQEHQSIWSQSLSPSLSPTKVLVSPDFIVVKLYQRQVHQADQALSITISYMVFSHEGQLLRTITYLDAQESFSRYQLGLTRLTTAEQIEGRTLYLLDYYISDRSNIDFFRINLVSLDLGSGNQVWFTRIYQNSLADAGVELVPGSFQMSSTQIQFQLKEAHSGRFTLITLLLDINGELLEDKSAQLRCGNCIYHFLQQSGQVITGSVFPRDEKVIFSTFSSSRTQQLHFNGALLSELFQPLANQLGVIPSYRDHVLELLITSITSNSVTVSRLPVGNSSWSGADLLDFDRLSTSLALTMAQSTGQGQRTFLVIFEIQATLGLSLRLISSVFQTPLRIMLGLIMVLIIAEELRWKTRRTSDPEPYPSSSEHRNQADLL